MRTHTGPTINLSTENSREPKCTPSEREVIKKEREREERKEWVSAKHLGIHLLFLLLLRLDLLSDNTQFLGNGTVLWLNLSGGSEVGFGIVPLVLLLITLGSAEESLYIYLIDIQCLVAIINSLLHPAHLHEAG